MNSFTRALQSVDIRLIGIVLSCCFSLIIIASSPIPNDDAFSYLRAAEIFSQQGLNSTLANYGWYWYSVLIACVGSLLPISLMNAAHLVNMLALAVLVYAFITLVMEFNQSTSVKLFAAVVILCYPTINEMRYFLIRDFAYWALCLSALTQFIRFGKNGNLINAWGWTLAMSVAVLFRLEGLILLAITPFSLLLPGLTSVEKKTARLFTLLFIMLAAALAILLVFAVAGINLFEVFNFTYRWYLPLLNEYPDTLSGAAQNAALSSHISEQVEIFTGRGMMVLIFGYVYALTSTLVMTISPAVCLFLFYGWISGRLGLSSENKWPWLFFLASALLVLLTFVSIMQFLTTRYAVLAALLLLSLLPLLIENLYQLSIREQSVKRFKIVFVSLALFFAADSLVSFGYSKSYIRQAGDWTRENITQGSKVQTNSFAVAYFSGLVADYDDIETDPAESFLLYAENDYLVLDLPHDDADSREVLGTMRGITEIARFANKRDDAIVVYQVLP